jgi:GNAT superfamily N-acetyltransferase
MTTAGRPLRRPAVRLDVGEFADATTEETEAWRCLQGRVYPPDEERIGADLQWAKREPNDYFIRLWADSDLRACAWLTRRSIAVGGRETLVAGVRGVMTDPAYRRLGLGRTVMERTHELIRSLAGCDFGLLFSSVMAVPFYESLGWQAVEGPVICEQPGGRINYTERLPMAPVMARMRDPRLRPPSSAIDVMGPPW